MEPHSNQSPPTHQQPPTQHPSITDSPATDMLIYNFIENRQFAAAANMCHQLLENTPTNLKLQAIMARCCVLMGRITEAIHHYGLCLAGGHEGYIVYRDMGYLYHELNYELSKKYLGQAIQYPPLPRERQSCVDIVNHKLMIPVINDSTSIAAVRKEYETNLDELIRSTHRISLDELVMPWDVSVSFRLAYHGVNNCKLLRKLSTMYRITCPDLNYATIPRAIIQKTSNTINSTKIKVGFISSFFRRHSVAHDRRGIISNLDRNIFQVYVFFLEDLKDAISHEIWNNTDCPVTLYGLTLAQIINTISEYNLDILVYCDIGMNMKSSALAHIRLAPVQVVTWGHSETTGINTIDYYISSKLYESSDHPEQYYSEKLILTEGLCTYYYNPLKIHSELFNTNPLTFSPEFTKIVTELNISAPNIYFCGQLTKKIHHVMDYSLQRILELDPNGIIIFINDNDYNMTRLKARLGLNCPREQSGGKGGEVPPRPRICFVSTVDWTGYLSMIYSAKVILDSFPFGGCNSSMEAFAVGRPVVTFPSERLYGRFTYGFYKKMGITDLVCTTAEEYAQTAVKLATDNKFYQEITTRITENSHLLFEDTESVREWNQILQKLHAVQPTPSHNNLYNYLQDLIPQDTPVAHVLYNGNAILWSSESEIIRDLKLNLVYSCSINNYNELVLREKIGVDGIILISGGGNFNDEYQQQPMRLKIISDFKTNTIIQLPQTIRFDIRTKMFRDTQDGLHKNLILMAREAVSLKLAKQYFPLTTVLLCTSTYTPTPQRESPLQIANPSQKVDIVAILRTDTESQYCTTPPTLSAPPPPQPQQYSVDVINSYGLRKITDLTIIASGYQFKHHILCSDRMMLTDWYLTSYPIPVNSGFLNFSNLSDTEKATIGKEIAVMLLQLGKVIITDRLQTCLLAQQLKIPVVLLDNQYGKISAYQQTWFPNVILAKNLTESYDKALSVAENSTEQ